MTKKAFGKMDIATVIQTFVRERRMSKDHKEFGISPENFKSLMIQEKMRQPMSEEFRLKYGLCIERARNKLLDMTSEERKSFVRQLRQNDKIVRKKSFRGKKNKAMSMLQLSGSAFNLMRQSLKQ